LCLSACPGDGEVKKIAAHPRENNIWNSPQFAVWVLFKSLLFLWKPRSWFWAI